MKLRYRFLKNTLLALLLGLPFFGGFSPLGAQKLIDSKGRDFWLTFLPNYHTGFYYADERYKLGDSLYIFITSEKPASGSIEYYERSGVQHHENFTIANPSEVYTFKVCYYNCELFGFNLSGKIIQPDNPNRYQSEIVSNMAFHVVSNEDITVYAHSQAVTTSEAFLVYPTDALGTEHIVMSYNTDGEMFSDVNEQTTPSEFAVVSAEDDNEITILPTCPTRYNQLIKQKVKLNKGEVYLVQADYNTQNLYYDLTGTKITSSKPLALFCGHQRATVPIANTDGYSSRDILIEQIPPIVTWGQNAFLVPYYPPTGVSTDGSDLYRIMSGSDGNIIGIDGTVVDTLDKGEYKEGKLIDPGVVTGTGPILVVQYKKTSSFDAAIEGYTGDPFIMVMPPKEQFMNSYRVINLQAYEFDNYYMDYEKVYEEQYITAIVQDQSIASFRLDNNPVPSSEFRTIKNSGYSYVHLSVTDGVHELACSDGFGVFVYGYGYANSYGYIGGMSFTRLDLPPVISAIDSCFSVFGTVTDSAGSDSGISDVLSPVEKEENVNVSIGSYQRYDKYVNFSAVLVDIYKDGRFTITARDTSGNVIIKDYPIPGFTVCHPWAVNADTLPVCRPQVDVNTEYCFKVPLYNYGSFQQIIKDLTVKKPAITIKYVTPDTLAPKETDSVELCILIKNTNPVIDTLFLEGPCGKRPVAVISIIKSDCDESQFVYDDFADDLFMSYSGQAKRVNDRIRLTSSVVNVHGAAWRKLMMPVRKGFVTEFGFSMSNGQNHTTTENSLPGADGIAFVIQNEGVGSVGTYGGGIGYEEIPNSVAIEFDMFRNDSTQLFDYKDPNGNHIAVQSLGRQPNSAKHTKEANLAITDTIMTIKPDDTPYYVRIEYNIKPDLLSIYLSETKEFKVPVLEIPDFRLENYIGLNREEFAYVGFTAATANSHENHDILSWSFCPKPTDSLQVGAEDNPVEPNVPLSVYPNPFDSYINIRFNTTGVSTAGISIYNILGEKVADVFNSTVEPGVHEIRFDAGKLPPGFYMCKLDHCGRTYNCNIVRIDY